MAFETDVMLGPQHGNPRAGLSWSQQELGMVAYKKRNASWVGIVRAVGDKFEVRVSSALGELPDIKFPSMAAGKAFIDSLYLGLNGDGLQFPPAPAPWLHRGPNDLESVGTPLAV